MCLHYEQQLNACTACQAGPLCSIIRCCPLWQLVVWFFFGENNTLLLFFILLLWQKIGFILQEIPRHSLPEAYVNETFLQFNFKIKSLTTRLSNYNTQALDTCFRLLAISTHIISIQTQRRLRHVANTIIKTSCACTLQCCIHGD